MSTALTSFATFEGAVGTALSVVFSFLDPKRTEAPVVRSQASEPANGGLVGVDFEALRSGDPRTLEQVLRLLMPKVRRWLHRLLGPRADLDDATQDALVALAGALPTFRGDSKVTTFAHRITVRIAYKYFRKRSREEVLALVPPPADEIDPESRAMDREALRRLYRCLERLPEKRRVAFVLCCIEGLKPGEAAKLEGISSLAMRSRPAPYTQLNLPTTYTV